MKATKPHTHTGNSINVIGRFCLVRDKKFDDRKFVGATVIDSVAGKNLAKRIRLQTGEHAGEVLMPGEYELLEFTSP